MEPLKCLTKECINLLHKNQLLLPLIKSEYKKNILSTIHINDELKNKILEKFKKDLSQTNHKSYQDWLAANNLNQRDFENIHILNKSKKKNTVNKILITK